MRSSVRVEIGSEATGLEPMPTLAAVRDAFPDRDTEVVLGTTVKVSSKPSTDEIDRIGEFERRKHQIRVNLPSEININQTFQDTQALMQNRLTEGHDQVLVCVNGVEIPLTRDTDFATFQREFIDGCKLKPSTEPDESGYEMEVERYGDFSMIAARALAARKILHENINFTVGVHRYCVLQNFTLELLNSLYFSDTNGTGC